MRFILSALASIVLLPACALHRTPEVYGCTLPGYISCFDGNPECLQKVEEEFGPKPFTYAVAAQIPFGRIADRVAEDFGVLMAKTAVQYRYVGWVTWDDGSYGVLFSDERPWITPTGITAPPTGSALSLGFNNRYLHRHVGKTFKPDTSVRVRNRDSLADLDLDFSCSTPIDGHALYSISHPVPLR